MLSVKKVARNTGKGTQYAALCYRRRRSGAVEILLVTSRGTGRWIPPKGWPMAGISPEQAAATEALEEAGATGQIYRMSLGKYRYDRPESTPQKNSTEAYIFPLKVKKRVSAFKEKGQRQVKWFKQKKAAKLVREPGLRKIIRKFDPTALDAKRFSR